MDSSIMIKLLFEYMSIDEIARMRILSKKHKEIIDRYWPTIEHKFLGSIGGGENNIDINIAAQMVYRNERLLAEVLKLKRLNTGYVLTRDGLDLSIMLSRIGQSKMSRDVMRAQNLEDDQIDLSTIYTDAYNDDLTAFKAKYYEHNHTMRTGHVAWEQVFADYLRGRLYRNTRNYAINWSEIENFSSTDFYKFIKPSLRAAMFVQLITMFLRVSVETRRREHNNIVQFIRKTFQPYIEQEEMLLRDICRGQIAKPPILYGHGSEYRTKHQVATSIMKNSIIRYAYSYAAIIDVDLSKEYFAKAHELFDLTDDSTLKDFPGNIVIGRTFELINIFHEHRYQIPISVYTLLMVFFGKLQIDDLDVHSVIKAKLMLMNGADPDDIRNKLGYDSMDPDLHAQLSIIDTMEFNKIPTEIVPWMTKKYAQKIYDMLDFKPYDIFITRDLDFWTQYISDVFGYSLESPPPDDDNTLVDLFNFHLKLESIDVLRYILMLMPPKKLKLSSVSRGSSVIDRLIDEVLVLRSIKVPKCKCGKVHHDSDEENGENGENGGNDYEYDPIMTRMANRHRQVDFWPINDDAN
jgi:hypothetical protein